MATIAAGRASAGAREGRGASIGYQSVGRPTANRHVGRLRRDAQERAFSVKLANDSMGGKARLHWPSKRLVDTLSEWTEWPVRQTAAETSC